VHRYEPDGSNIRNSSDIFTFDCFTKKQVKEINRKIKENIIQEEDPSLPSSPESKIGKFSHVPCAPLFELLGPWLYQCQLVNRNMFGYDVYWDFHLEVLNYNKYGKNGEYEWHVDVQSDNTYDLKLTCLLNLSEEPYEGGDLYIVGNNEKQRFNSSGSGIVFNSLLSHKVTPVTKGERITLRYWGEGPSWK